MRHRGKNRKFVRAEKMMVGSRTIDSWAEGKGSTFNVQWVQHCLVFTRVSIPRSTGSRPQMEMIGAQNI